MSRSKKEPIVKDRPRNHKKSTEYWRKVRRVINDKVRQFIYGEKDLPEPEEIVNDYDYSDYKVIAKSETDKKKLSRK